MKKGNFWVLLILLSLTLSGCRQTENQNSREEAARRLLNSPCEISGTLISEQIAEPVQIDVETGEGVIVRLTAPDTVRGLEVRFSGNSAEIRFRGMKMPLSEGDLPEPSVLTAFRDMFSAGAAERAKWKKDRLTSSSGLTEYEIVWPPEAEQPQEIRFPNLGGVFRVEQYRSRASDAPAYIRTCFHNYCTPSGRPFCQHPALLSLAIRQDSCGKAPCLLTEILVHPSYSGYENRFKNPRPA